MELEPGSTYTNFQLGWSYAIARQTAAAEQQLLKTLDLDPQYAIALLWLGVVRLQQGRWDEALSQFERSRDASSSDTSVVGAIGHVYGLAGRRAEAMKVIGQLQELSTKGYVSAILFAQVYSGLGDNDRAIEYLNKAFDAYDAKIPSLNFHPWWDPLRDDRRFKDLVRRTGLKP